MPLTWIDGREIAKKWKENAAQRAQALTEKGVTPHLAVIVAGDNPASQVYVRNKENACLRAGIRSTILRLPESCTQEELESAVASLNADQSVHGILVQLPLPKGLDEARVLALIDPEKDVDGFHAMNAGKLMSGQPGFVPCTPLGVMKLLEAYNIPTRGRHAVVIGRSNIVGKPMAMLLLQQDGTVTVCHSGTPDLAAITRQADILVSAVGRVGLITADMVKEGAVVIDVAMNRNEAGKLCGDVDYEAVEPRAACITPVPGGVGPMTRAMLMRNILAAARRHQAEI